MKQTNTFLKQTLDERQVAILIGLCVAACRETLHASSMVNATNNEVAGNQQARTGRASGYPGDRNITAVMSHSDVVVGAETNDVDGLQYQEQQNHDQAPRMIPQLLLTVEQAAHMLSIGRSLMYELVSGGKVASITIGRVRRIPMIELEAFVHRRLAESA